MTRFNQNINLEKLVKVSEAEFRKKLPPVLRGKNVIFTAYGRNALYLGLKAVAQKTTKRTVLVPAYSCGDEIKTIINAGFNIKTYNVKSSDLSVDMNDLLMKVNKNTAAILITHYFGFLQKEISKIRDLCVEKKVYLVEDCAHALCTKTNGKFTGQYGDFAIFSLRKFYPVPHGGALVINNKSLKAELPKSMPQEALFYDLSMFFGFRSGRILPGTAIGGDDIFGPRLSPYGGYALGLSDFAKSAIAQTDKDAISDRYINYAYYHRYFSNKGSQVTPLIDNKITKNVTPSLFPVSVSDSEYVCRSMRKNGVILAQPFWSHVHKFVDWKKYPEVKYIKQNTIVLPVSHRLSKKELDLFIKYAN